MSGALNGFGVALGFEARKGAASRVMVSITVLLVAGVAAIALGMLLAAASGQEQVLAKLGPLAGLDGWARLVGVVVQVTAAAGLGAFGVALSWMFGREFADGTVSALFALPVSRSTIALAKLAVYGVWTAGVAVLLTVVIGVLGFAMGFGTTDAPGLGELARIPALAAFTALIAVPSAWASTIGRGLLPGIGAAVIIMVIAQVLAVSGTGTWLPIVAPALWAIEPDSVPAAALLTVPGVPLIFGALCALAWSRLQLDR
jgi:ABC-2 type transport system permease protein